MNKKFLDSMKKQLLMEKENICNQASKIQSDVDLDGDEVDEIQGKLLINISNQLVQRNEEKLTKIEDALKKINDGNYGSCEDCGEDISEKRLLNNPHFLICISCAEDKEMAAKQRRSS